MALSDWCGGGDRFGGEAGVDAGAAWAGDWHRIRIGSWIRVGFGKWAGKACLS